MSLPSRSPSRVRCPIFWTRTKIRPERRHRRLRCVAIFLPRFSASDGCDDESAESHSHLQALQRDELVLWVEEHQIESQGKRPTRRDLIDAIAGATKSEQPSKEDIESIVKESSKSSKSACSQANQLVVKQACSQANQFKVKKIGPQSTKSQLKVIIDFN
ncbi:hypothetical protein EDB85DRAFT_1890613 [Lactarius pseudohatsudake]|nr:hypothetical protein EDB85DRAFT_1890613 [Lactarius pseudohatsudake]